MTEGNQSLQVEWNIARQGYEPRAGGWSMESQVENEERQRWRGRQEEIIQDVVGHNWSFENNGKSMKDCISVWRLGWSLSKYKR